MLPVLLPMVAVPVRRRISGTPSAEGFSRAMGGSAGSADSSGKAWGCTGAGTGLAGAGAPATTVRSSGGAATIVCSALPIAFWSSAASGADWIQMWTTWRQCNLLKVEAERRGTRIVNATRGGLLNMFERRQYEDII